MTRIRSTEFGLLGSHGTISRIFHAHASGIEEYIEKALRDLNKRAMLSKNGNTDIPSILAATNRLFRFTGWSCRCPAEIQVNRCNFTTLTEWTDILAKNR